MRYTLGMTVAALMCVVACGDHSPLAVHESVAGFPDADTADGVDASPHLDGTSETQQTNDALSSGSDGDADDPVDTDGHDMSAPGGADGSPELWHGADALDDGSDGSAPADGTDMTPPADAAPDGTPQALVGPTCFADIFDPEAPGPDYDQFSPSIASHCWGTDHQDIVGIEDIVFLGDSVTVGTPNLEHPLSTDNSHFWRNKFAQWAASHFGLSTGNAIEWGLWKAYDYVSGKGGLQSAGDFRNCSEWGARTDDLLEGGGQIPACFPAGGSTKKTLIVFTIGGNDINAITESGGEATPQEVADNYPEAWELAYATVDYLVDALAWLTDPARFPAGSHVIFANPFEFTDGTGDVGACPVAGLTGLKDWEDPEQLQEIVSWVLEQFMAAATHHGVDMVWMLEHFCGHGYVATGPLADPNNRCYRGPDTPIWFDETCIHPNEAGHAAIFEMFKATVVE